MKRVLISLGISLVLLTLVPTTALAATEYALPDPTNSPFDDVSPYSPAYKAITCLRSLGVIHGYFDNKKLKNDFLPSRVLKRNEALKLAIRTGAVTINRRDEVQFDGSFGSNMSDLVQYASGNDIINPVIEESAFRGEDNVTRFEFLKMAIKSNGIQVNKTVRDRDTLDLYIDVDPTSAFVPYVLRAQESNLMEPSLMSWDQLGKLRTLNWLTDEQLQNLTGEQVIPVFRGNNWITRESAADFLYRLLNVKRDGFFPPFDPNSPNNICKSITGKSFQQ